MLQASPRDRSQVSGSRDLSLSVVPDGGRPLNTERQRHYIEGLTERIHLVMDLLAEQRIPRSTEIRRAHLAAMKLELIALKLLDKAGSKRVR